MKPHRISVKYFVADPEAVDLTGMIPTFHAWIQQSKVPGLLIDVADYQHVATGPQVVLVGHEADYAMDRSDGRLGLRHTRKRCRGEDLRTSVAGAFHATLLACRTLEQEAGIRFRTDQAELILADRLRAPNRTVTFEQARGEIETVLTSLYGGVTVRIERDAKDQRRSLTIRISVRDAPDMESLIS